MGIAKSENNFPLYLFHQGTNTKAYEYMGAHRIEGNGREKPKLAFRVWAPNAEAVSLVGDFNRWDPEDVYKRQRMTCAWRLGVGMSAPL